jgi:hypothetical protein
MNNNSIVTLLVQDVAEELITALVYNKGDLANFLITLIQQNQLDIDIALCRRMAQLRQAEINKAA